MANGKKSANVAFAALENILSGMSDPGFLVDTGGKIVYANTAAAHILKSGPQELNGIHINSVLFGSEQNGIDGQPDTNARYAPFALHPENPSIDRNMIARANNGREIPVSISCSCVKDARGTPAGVAVIARDMTERNRMQDRLEQANAELRQFLYISSHHLQEPFRNIVSYLQLLEKQYKGKIDATADQYIDYAVDASVWMKHLLCDLTDYSALMLEPGQKIPVDFNKTFELAERNLSAVIQRLGATITCGPLPIVQADPRRSVRLLQDLIDNALRFHGEQPPRIEVMAKKVDALSLVEKSWRAGRISGVVWLFSVNDNSIGIAREHLERIFNVFERLHPRPRYVGTGIGLAICKRIVEQAGGGIWAESQEGAGSTFYFFLPV